jgi:tRNA(Ile)-lysidine synthase
MMQPLEQLLLNTWPAQSWSQTRLLLAVSGGADSVALLRAIVNLADRRELIHVAHFNHQWRGSESDCDERFVRELCSQLSLSLSADRASELNEIVTQRTEQAARDARYAFLTKTAYTVGARYVVTAHTASDRVETMLHNLCRGTGMTGVTTPTRFRNLDQDLVLARPLLSTTRSQIVDYLTTLGQEYRNDSSNLNTAYKRNFIRHKLLPLMQSEYGDQVESHLLDFSQIAEEAASALRFYAQRWLDDSRSKECAESELVFSSAALRRTPWPVVQLALESCWKQKQWPLQPMTRTHWLQIRDLALADESLKTWQVKMNLPGSLRISTMAGWLRIDQ